MIGARQLARRLEGRRQRLDFLPGQPDIGDVLVGVVAVIAGLTVLRAVEVGLGGLEIGQGGRLIGHGLVSGRGMEESSRSS